MIAYEPISPSGTGADDPMGSSDMPKANATPQGTRPLHLRFGGTAAGRLHDQTSHWPRRASARSITAPPPIPVSEVALKLILRNLDIERRFGVMQCMNLEMPELADHLRHEDQRSCRGDAFVVMEYVAGPSLASVSSSSTPPGCL